MPYLDEKGLARFWSKVKEYINAHNGGGGGIPSGCILIWSGASNAVPDGWVLCDGTNGTPDLRGRFVLGESGSHSVGSVGGAEEVTLTVEQMPSHGHQYDYYGTSRSGALSSSGTKYDYCMADTFSKRTTNGAGSSNPHPNMPPYYVLCYIMKM